jgi:hypothetical protein
VLSTAVKLYSSGERAVPASGELKTKDTAS